MIYTVFINGQQKDYSNKYKAYAIAFLYGTVVFTRERYFMTLEEQLSKSVYKEVENAED